MNPVPKPLFLALALAAASAHAIPCPAPIEVPEGEGIEASPHVCGALGVFDQHGKKGDKWGYINPQGKTVQPFEYEAAEAFTHNWMGSRERECVEAQKNGKRVAIDPQGKTLPENTRCELLPPPNI
ncbi:Uncharacterised protein [Cardiobacterium hominis]|uniref:WG repeat-containing protein n=1 Tax=Cardiobacterium hominis TaxID=2718 RepID=UPI0002F8D5E2|nr:WG repeat-containing protein [Cardiobacterium hominis]VEG76327.1 Uncharacterised protein [Cardiobacterium hominis]